MIGVDRTGKFELIPVGRIRPVAQLIRSRPSPEELESLTASIRRHGVLQPVLVRPVGRDFEIICGIRRWLAAREAGLGVIPAIVRELDAREAIEIAIAENRDRKPLTEQERRRALTQLSLLFPTRSTKELESWIGPAEAEPARSAPPTRIDVPEPALPAWMDESAPAETVETHVAAPEKYWLDELAARAPEPPPVTDSGVRRRLLPAVREFLEEFTKTGMLDQERLGKLTGSLLESMEKDPPHLFLDLVYREPAKKYLPRHCLNVAKLAVYLGRAHGLARHELEELSVSGLLHDVGMFQVDETVFKKKTALSDEEWSRVRSHPREGSILLTKEALLREVVARVALEHHERADGSGYPEGKTREEMHIYARILNIVDTFEAITSPRVHRLPLLPHEGMRHIMDEGARGMLDWDLVELFAKTMAVFPIGSYVRVQTGEIGLVIRANPETPALPVVKIVADASRAMLKKPVILDLSLQDPGMSFEAIPKPF